MKLFIRNMVCNRCILAVRQEFEKYGLKVNDVKLGEVELEKTPSPVQLQKINASLKNLGFEILDDKRKKLIERIKALLIEKIREENLEEHFVLSGFLTKALHMEYSRISRLFSEVEGITIEQFFILQKVEKVKELIAYDELSLSEIAWKLGYSSVAHLSAQFKKVTGLTPSHFKKLGVSHRRSLDDII